VQPSRRDLLSQISVLEESLAEAENLLRSWLHGEVDGRALADRTRIFLDEPVPTPVEPARMVGTCPSCRHDVHEPGRCRVFVGSPDEVVWGIESHRCDCRSSSDSSD